MTAVAHARIRVLSIDDDRAIDWESTRAAAKYRFRNVLPAPQSLATIWDLPTVPPSLLCKGYSE
jgi:hypothetical protein